MVKIFWWKTIFIFQNVLRLLATRSCYFFATNALHVWSGSLAQCCSCGAVTPTRALGCSCGLLLRMLLVLSLLQQESNPELYVLSASCNTFSLSFHKLQLGTLTLVLRSLTGTNFARGKTKSRSIIGSHARTPVQTRNVKVHGKPDPENSSQPELFSRTRTKTAIHRKPLLKPNGKQGSWKQIEKRKEFAENNEINAISARELHTTL